MSKFGRKSINGKRVAVAAAVFLLAASGYVLSDVILRQNSMRISGDGAYAQGNFSGLVNWLPKDARTAIEYRARSLYLQNRMKRTRDSDAKVRAVFAFADYIKERDPKGSDAVMTSIVTRPEFKNSRWAYDGYARLLLDKKSSRPVSIAELHAYLASLTWPEDRLKAWTAVDTRLRQLRASPQLYFEVMAPILETPPPFRNYDRFFYYAARYAKTAKSPEKAAAFEKIYTEFRKRPSLATSLLNADETYRIRYREVTDDIAKAKNAEEKVRSLTAKAMLTRGMEEAESRALFDRLLDDPELKNAPNVYLPLSRLLLYRKNRRWIPISRYHAELQKLKADPVRLLDAWQSGWTQLVDLKANDRTMLGYLAPLLEQKQEYQEYSELFRELAKHAKAAGDTARAEAAEKFLSRVQNTDMPSLFETDPTGAGKGK